jgi:hypothetical protein
MNSHISVIFLAICKSQNNLGIYQVQEMWICQRNSS